MKKIVFLLGVVFALASCTTITKTAKVADSQASLLSSTVADLEVYPERISYTLANPDKKLQRAGLSNVKMAAIQEALKDPKAKGADILVDAEFVVEQTNYFIFGKDIESVTVTGRPAKYKNFHSLNDSVWCNPTFRDNYHNTVRRLGGGIFGK